jgi:hypothetical protein
MKNLGSPRSARARRRVSSRGSLADSPAARQTPLPSACVPASTGPAPDATVPIFPPPPAARCADATILGKTPLLRRAPRGVHDTDARNLEAPRRRSRYAPPALRPSLATLRNPLLPIPSLGAVQGGARRVNVAERAVPRRAGLIRSPPHAALRATRHSLRLLRSVHRAPPAAFGKPSPSLQHSPSVPAHHSHEGARTPSDEDPLDYRGISEANSVDESARDASGEGGARAR